MTQDILRHSADLLERALDEALHADPSREVRLRKAREGLLRTREQLDSGYRYTPGYRIANGASTVADYYMQTNTERARELLELAVLLLESERNDDGRYTPTIEYCRERLGRLGPAPAAAVRTGPAPGPVPGPVPSPAGLIPQQTTNTGAGAGAGAGADASAGTGIAEGGPAVAVTAAVAAVAPAPEGGAVTAAADAVAGGGAVTAAADAVAGAGVAVTVAAGGETTTVGFGASRFSSQMSPTRDWDTLLGDWRSGPPDDDTVRRLVAELGARITELFGKHAPVSSESLLPVLDEDLQELPALLALVSVPGDDAQALHQRAKDARSTCRSEMISYAKGDTVVDVRILRRHWLASALWNYAVEGHWHSSSYQTLADILGYLQLIQISYRYHEAKREQLLDVTETAVLLALGELRDPELNRVQYVYSWLRHAIGIHLLVGGPDPTAPKELRFNELIQDSRFSDRHIYAEYWAVRVLNRWTEENRHRSSVALTLLKLSGWKVDRLDRLLDLLYSSTGYYADTGTPEEQQAAHAFWRKAGRDMLATIRMVRVARNPWESGSATATGFLSMGDQDASVQVSNRLLQGIAAELAPGPQGTMVQGALFAGRPVPTFLALDSFGPVGVLKIDEVAKVRREKENFDRFAEAYLRPVYRASKCVVGSTTIANSSNGDLYQGIFTSYVFRHRDEPKTLRDWVRTANPDALQPVIEEVFMDALGPWLSQAQRTIGDLRGEYPALRPVAFELTSYAPGKNVESELEHFRLPEVAETFGIDGGLPWQHRTLEYLLGNSALGSSPFAADPAYKSVTNPLWLVAHMAETGKRDPGTEDLFERLLYDRQYGVTTASYLTCICHGDLHGENVLASGPDGGRPDLYVIDFETTHQGHICKDFARLESALWSRTFSWNQRQLQQVRSWFVGSLRGTSMWEPDIPEDTDPDVRRVLLCIAKLRAILKGCEQKNWPFGEAEYQWALLASLLPFARYRDHEAQVNRHLPFLLAADVADVLVEHAEGATSGT
ncbi:phosphotransferase [Streptomyces sp. NPDC085479]|uniref:phosphotransferase n=1 Tax=Streptomyces sp. NPDC085479 TaxID=3365726 RepID=UPI0037D78C9C